jgi:hypothetical protein
MPAEIFPPTPRLLRATPEMVGRGTVFAWLDEEFGA